ncbi:MAG: hypothetical protein A7316_05045 [Candidatus Altiarchaeales archaeon WOR_SM1_86-2]|nr:MAG: hypothetical protein A7316_05045 [Candidatus Altiarchaeales archaeon WOR_SM1_86-2]ODS40465.1 MAG: hypothetical protein A7315_08375 [Candidatus Altiarchaeales archaeon WOR_SM1_79]
MEIPYDLLGRIFVAVIVIILIVIVLGLIFAYITYKRKRMIFSGFVLFILDSFYIPAKRIISFFGGNDRMVEIVAVEIRNVLMKDDFDSVKYEDRIVILPQCLRSLECPAKMSSFDGIKCIECNRCKVCEIKKKANELGYGKTFVITGGSFIKRIISKHKPKAVLGVACPYEAYWGMLELEKKGIPSQAVLLLKEGCVETDADLDEVYERMGK